jgi:CPA1 family monovalent cation:H+ antiporter
MSNNDFNLLIAFAMIALTALTSLVARRLRVPQSILLVSVGAALAFLPKFPRVTLHPDFVLLLLLPPLLYNAGVGMSWRGFKNNLRSIMLMAVGCVLWTAFAVAAAMHWLLHMPWPVGFVLGAVVSPPDAVAPMAIAKRLAVPRRILTVLEGEGLVNDATALILFTFAIAAVRTGSISLVAASINFGLIVAAEIAWGLAVGFALLRLRHWSKDTDVEMILALLTPYIAFWPPHYLGGSGVLAAVTAGLYTSWNGPALISSSTRLQGFFVWGLVVYIVEGVVFFLTGLQSRAVVAGANPDAWSRMLLAAAITVGVVIVVRFVWVFAVSYGRRFWQAPSARSTLGWRGSFLVGFTGIRGVVSLVAALSIPQTVGDAPFPERDLILFVTFCVILSSLVGQGTALPSVIRKLGLDRTGAQEAEAAKRAEVAARISGVEAVLRRLDELEREHLLSRSAASLRRMHEDRRIDLIQTADSEIEGAPAADAAQVQLQLVAAERASIAAQFAAEKLSDEARRRVERELDLQDAWIRHAADSATGGGFREI